MKKNQLFLAIAFMVMWATKSIAQEISVVYSTRFNTESSDLFKEAGLPEEMRRSLVNAYSNVEFTYLLAYTEGESEFRMLPSDKKQEIMFMGQKMDISAMMKEQSQNTTYKNHQTKQMISKTSFLGKKFLIIDTISAEPFSIIEGERKDILGFECKKAMSADGKKVIWFTEHIPVADGPISTNLPGLILEAHLDQYIYTATNIDDNIKQFIEVPTGGKKMTNAEFQEMVQKQTEMLKRGTGNL